MLRGRTEKPHPHAFCGLSALTHAVKDEACGPRHLQTKTSRATVLPPAIRVRLAGQGGRVPSLDAADMPGANLGPGGRREAERPASLTPDRAVPQRCRQGTLWAAAFTAAGPRWREWRLGPPARSCQRARALSALVGLARPPVSLVTLGDRLRAGRRRRGKRSGPE